VLSAARIVDRGRLLIGLLVVIPLGVLVVAPPGSGGAPEQPQWTAQYGSPGSAAVAAGGTTPQDIVANLTNGSAATAGAVPHADGEAEGEVTTELPANYIPGTPPGADLVEVLRASERRNGLAAPPPTATAGAAALAQNPNVRYTRQSQVDDLTSGAVDPRVVDLLTWIAARYQITITSMRTDHSTYVAGTNRVSAHHLGRAFDIGDVNGQICTGIPNAECGRLYEDIVNQLRGTHYQPSQVIYGYDPWPLEAWNFEMGNHHDHIHVGY
jgi:hypothetical protein